LSPLQLVGLQKRPSIGVEECPHLLP